MSATFPRETKLLAKARADGKAWRAKNSGSVDIIIHKSAPEMFCCVRRYADPLRKWPRVSDFFGTEAEALAFRRGVY